MIVMQTCSRVFDVLWLSRFELQECCLYGLVDLFDPHLLTAALVYIHHLMYHALCFREQENANRIC